MTNRGGHRDHRHEYENWRSTSISSKDRNGEACGTCIERERFAADKYLGDNESGKECGREVTQHVCLSRRERPPSKYDWPQRLHCDSESAQEEHRTPSSSHPLFAPRNEANAAATTGMPGGVSGVRLSAMMAPSSAAATRLMPRRCGQRRTTKRAGKAASNPEVLRSPGTAAAAAPIAVAVVCVA